MKATWPLAAQVALLLLCTLACASGESVGAGSGVAVKSVAILKPCGTFEQQVLTIIKALLYSKKSKFTLIIPPFHDPSCQDASETCAVSFSTCFDKQKFLDQATSLGYSVYIQESNSAIVDPEIGEDAKTLSCAFPFPYDLLDSSKEALSLLSALKPSALLHAKVKAIPKNIVYVRVEAKQAKDALHNILSDPEIWGTLHDIQFASFDSKNQQVDLPVEEDAAVDVNAEWRSWNAVQATAFHYFYALQAKYFFGSCASEFSSLIVVHRRSLNLWAATFDQGILHPPEVQLLDPMVWVFTYNSWSTAYDYMLKGVVLSVQSFGYRPFCLYGGGNESSIHDWMIKMGITIIHHNPEWGDRLWSSVLPFRAKNLQHSHLYASKEMVVGTWQRIDIPILPQLQQYTFVLFTDCDVFFSQKVTLLDFKDILPVSALMGPEMQDYFPWNAGIMLMNIPYLRSTYKDFLSFILRNKEGMYFGGNFGPGDQGAYNCFYEKSLRPLQLPKAYNSKPYQPVLSTSKIVHFHGPKPHHYLKFFESGDCDFGTLCRQGFEGALCTYVSSYARFAEEIPTAKHLDMACKALVNTKRHLQQKGVTQRTSGL